MKDNAVVSPHHFRKSLALTLLRVLVLLSIRLETTNVMHYLLHWPQLKVFFLNSSVKKKKLS